MNLLLLSNNRVATPVVEDRNPLSPCVAHLTALFSAAAECKNFRFDFYSQFFCYSNKRSIQYL